ncbi:uncharacterized protein LOC132563598 [Ylistrum balloti]|uniref:uncharacterized protein LOC132563598 n=1 Tax=Ylistrum balloti TaxID=509963 RepID=UPI00290597D8|nr:uncharacterized protein LOC132563598 [Ylistrum balloti]
MAIRLNENMRKFAIFFLLLKASSSVVLEFTEITAPMSWDDAFLTRKCRIQSDVAGDVNPENVKFNQPIDNVTEAWVGLFATSSNALTFESCRLYAKENLVGPTEKLKFDNQTDLIGSCYRFCNFTRFGLSNDTCFCLEDDVDTFHPAILFDPSSVCLSGYRALCGFGLINVQNIAVLVLCTYRPVAVNPIGTGDCSSYDIVSRQTKMVDCSLKKSYVCYEATENGQTMVPSNDERGWWEAAAECTQQTSFFGSKTFVTRHIEASGTTVDSYWTNMFRRTSYTSLSPASGETDPGRCVAIRNNSGIFRLIVKACNFSLPALCNAFVTTGSNVITNTVFQETEPVLWPLAFVALGMIIIMVVSVILWRKNKASMRKMRTSKLIKHMSYGSRKPESNHGFKIGNVLSYETSFIESEPNRVKTTRETPSVSPNNETTGEQEENTTAPPPDNIYNELHEKETDKQTDDTYDHTRNINLNDGTYDGFRRSDSLGNDTEADNLEYDTMANINAQSTEGNSIYDTCSNDHIAKPEVTDLNEYDSMSNIHDAKLE